MSRIDPHLLSHALKLGWPAECAIRKWWTGDAFRSQYAQQDFKVCIIFCPFIPSLMSFFVAVPEP